MNINLQNAIIGAKAIIDEYIKNANIARIENKTVNSFVYKNDHNGYQQAYFATNENIGSYLCIYDISNKSNALTVTSSGDHTFNLITEGILNIDTFDVNMLTEYLALGLKRAMIVKYNFKDYIHTLKILLNESTPILEITDILSGLLPYMDKEHRIFLSEILNYNFKMQQQYALNKNIIDILFIGTRKIEKIMFNNNYLLNEEQYNKLRNNIGKANISFTYADANNLGHTFKGKEYDLVLLSNILGYFNSIYGNNWNYEILKNYLNDLKNITKDDGVIYFYYLFLYEWFTGIKKYTRDNVISNSDIVISDLTEEKIHSFNTQHDMIKDAVALVKVRKQ